MAAEQLELDLEAFPDLVSVYTNVLDVLVYLLVNSNILIHRHEDHEISYQINHQEDCP